MVSRIDDNFVLDYVEFRIYPSQNRYEACICYCNNIEIVNSGILEPLAMHSSKIKALCSKGSDETFELQPPDNLNDDKWFTRSVLMRFVHIIDSSDVLDKAIAMQNEIAQLEESRGFHASIYAKADDSSITPDASKNELLRAMESRLETLRGELEKTWYQAAGTVRSSEEIALIQKFCHHFGAVNLKNSLQKFLELSQERQSANFDEFKDSFPETDSRNASAGLGFKDSDIVKEPNLDTHVVYTASPAKVAQTERQSSSEGDESSCISEEDQPSVERTRSVVRSSSLRRIQIGRSGSRRSTALTIKSLSHFSQRNDSERSEDEETEQGSNIVFRMSVQDKISLFEKKQKSQTDDVQKTTSGLVAPVSTTASKAVLRRWSAGMMSADSASMTDNIEEQEPKSGYDFEVAEVGDKSGTCEESVSNLEAMMQDETTMQDDNLEVHGGEESIEKLVASAESFCKNEEEELKLLQTDMIKPKPERRGTKTASSDVKDKSFSNGQRFRASNERLRGEGKAEIKSGNSSSVVKRPTQVKKTPRMSKNSPESANPKDKTPKPAVVAKNVSRAKTSLSSSSLPVTRISWPSTPSPAASGASQGTRSSQRFERSKPEPVSTKTSPSDVRKTVKSSIRKQEQEASQRFERSKPEAVSKKTSPSDLRKTAKSSIRKQEQEARGATRHTKTEAKAKTITKKSDTAPLELKEQAKKPKPLLHKDSRTTKDSDRVKENVTDSLVPEQDRDLETETHPKSPQKCEETGNSEPVSSNNEVDSSQEKHVSEEKPEISPASWIEIEEHEDDQIPYDNSNIRTELESVAIAQIHHSFPQKEEPKGLKKLLKFARKSKTEANTTHLSKPNAHAKNYRNKQALPSESHGLSGHQAGKGKLVSQSVSQKSPEGSKATRSFFSLSAFKGVRAE